MQPDNRLLTNLIKCEKEHHSALLALLVRSHTSLAALSAYASAAAPPVAHALLGCIQAFAAADEGLRGYAAAVEGWKEELKEVKRVEDELKSVVRDKDILVGRLIKASKQKIPTSSLQAGPAPIPNASYLAPSSPSSSSFSLPSTSQAYGQTGYQYTPTPHATQHINSKLALAQRELHACEAHLAGKEAELSEVRRSAMTEGMARRCRAMADVGNVWRERGEQGLGALEELGREGAGAPPPPPHAYIPSHSRSSSYTGSSLAPSHSASQYQPRAQSPFTRSQSPYGLPRSTSPFGTYQTLTGGYQHSHPLPALPERDSWHGERGREPDRTERDRPTTYHPGMSNYGEADRRPVSSLGLGPADHVELDIPPAHSIGDHGDIIPVGRPVSSVGHSASAPGSRWGDESSEEGEEGYNVVENERWRGGGQDEGGMEDVDPEILRAVEKMGMVAPPKPKPHHPPTPPASASPTASPVALPDLRVIEATPTRTKGAGKKTETDKVKRRSTRKKDVNGPLLTAKGMGVGAPAPEAEQLVPTPTRTASAALPMPGARPSPAPATPATPSPISKPADVPASPAARDAPSATLTASPPAPAHPTPIHSPKLEPTPTRTLEPAQPVPTEPSRLDDSVSPTHDATLVGSATQGADVSGTEPEDKAVESGHMEQTLPSREADEAVTEVDPDTTITVDTAEVPAPTMTMAIAPTAPPSAPANSKARAPKHRMTSSASEPLVLDPARAKSTTKRRVASGGMDSAGENSGTERGGRKKSGKRKTTRPAIPARQPSAEERADLAAMLRDPNAPSPHVHFPANGGMYVPTAPPPPKQPGLLFLPSTGGGTTRSDVGPARANHFEMPPPSPARSTGRGRSGSGSVSFFGRVAGLFGRKKPSGDSYGSSGGGNTAWRTRIGANIGRTQGAESSDEEPANVVAVSNVNTPAARVAAIDHARATGSPKLGPGRKLTKADKGQTLRVGPPESPVRTRKTSLTGAEREERFESAAPANGKAKKAKGGKVRSVDGGGLSRKGSLKSTTSEPVGTGRSTSLDIGNKKRGQSSLMALVESPGLVLPSEMSTQPSPAPARIESPAPARGRGQSPARSQTPQSLLSVPPARMVSPATTAAPKPMRATSPMPLKSAMRNTTPSPMPPVHAPTAVVSPHVTSPGLSVAPPIRPSPSPRHSISESMYETGEEEFEDPSDGEAGKSDVTAAGRDYPALPPIPTSPGTALAAFKDTISAPTSDTAASVSTAGPYSTGTQPARRKSVRINPDPPEMSATPAATPAMELEEEPQWTQRKEGVADGKGEGGWATRIGRGWEDSSEESGEDEEYERVRKALLSSHKHLDAVNGGVGNGKGREKARR